MEGVKILGNLIIIEDGEDYQFDNIEDVVKELLDKNYYELTNDKKKQLLRTKAIANCINENMQVVDNFNINCDSIDNKFIINDEITYILSLLITNNIVMLEKADANMLAKDLDKSDLKNNYIILNKFAKELLCKYLKK